MAVRPLRTYAFTAWVFVSVAVSMFYPAAFGTWFGSDLKILIVPLIQVIMFGMGTTLSLADFPRILAMPWPVVVGFVLQFSIMPCRWVLPGARPSVSSRRSPQAWCWSGPRPAAWPRT